MAEVSKKLPCCKSESELLNAINDTPHVVFAQDLLFFLCRKSGIEGIDFFLPCYDIHPNSPLTTDIRRILYNFFENHQGYFKEGYQTDVARDWPKEIIHRKFCLSIEDFLSRLSSSDVTADEVLTRVINAAILSVDFYNCGFSDAIEVCIRYTSDALQECNKRHDFRLFEMLAEEARAIMNPDSSTEI